MLHSTSLSLSCSSVSRWSPTSTPILGYPSSAGTELYVPGPDHQLHHGISSIWKGCLTSMSPVLPISPITGCHPRLTESCSQDDWPWHCPPSHDPHPDFTPSLTESPSLTKYLAQLSCLFSHCRPKLRKESEGVGNKRSEHERDKEVE